MGVIGGAERKVAMLGRKRKRWWVGVQRRKGIKYGEGIGRVGIRVLGECVLNGREEVVG